MKKFKIIASRYFKGNLEIYELFKYDNLESFSDAVLCLKRLSEQLQRNFDFKNEKNAIVNMDFVKGELSVSYSDSGSKTIYKIF